MTAKQIMDFAEENANDENNFFFLRQDLQSELDEITGKLESQPKNKVLLKKAKDLMEKLRMLNIMYEQRMELFTQAKQATERDMGRLEKYDN